MEVSSDGGKGLLFYLARAAVARLGERVLCLVAGALLGLQDEQRPYKTISWPSKLKPGGVNSLRLGRQPSNSYTRAQSRQRK